ncbi:RUS family member 1 isoform X2 [Diachasmimorpha longicaudata]
MSSEIIYHENRINKGKDENMYMKSDKERYLIKKLPGFPKEQTFLTVQRLIFLIRSVFLPEGFPDSVHPDYVPYQIWDTVQAFASTILGTLTTHSILIGVGVGESTATPLAATISWILKDGAGMIGRILFAWWNGSQLDAQCKKWRIFADVLNDIAMGIELLLPYFSKTSTTFILCATTSMKSIVGVAGGATRAALTQHQALNNNLADVSAKDGSQETFVNLVASFVGIFILNSLHDSVTGGFLLYIVLVIIHVYANYSAVRALRFNSLNEDRLALLLHNYARYGRILEVEECNKIESLLLLEQPFKRYCGFKIKLGVSLATILGQKTVTIDDISTLSTHFHNKKFIIIPDADHRRIYVGLNADAGQTDILQAYYESFLHGIRIDSSLSVSNRKKSDNQEIIKSIVANGANVSAGFQSWYELLNQSGWNRETSLLPIGEWRARWVKLT